MKADIITLHKITNFGSMLQTYATQTAVEKLGYEAEIIDFIPDGITFKRACWPKNNVSPIKKIIKFLPLFGCNVAQFGIMKRFMKRYVHLSKKQYSCYQDIVDSIPQADAYISGSDQVWNTQNNNPNDDLKAYYLGFVPEGKKRIAYAGSFGKNEFTEGESAIIKEFIARYDAVSVREDDGLKILERHGFTNGVHVVDPTMLLTPEEWLQFADKKALKPGYIFVYNLNRNALLKQLAKRIAKEKGFRIVNFADSLDFISGAENRLFNTALDFINYLSHADLVLTDSFHGTAFSINFGKQFITVKAPRYNSRLESILRQTGLIEGRMVSTVEDGMRACEEQIDYSAVTPIVEAARNKSFEYLKQALSQ